MRTTLDLSDDLLRQAKVAAIQHGMTLKELFSQALREELVRLNGVPSPSRVSFPLISSGSPITSLAVREALSKFEDEDDLRGTGFKS